MGAWEGGILGDGWPGRGENRVIGAWEGGILGDGWPGRGEY